MKFNTGAWIVLGVVCAAVLMPSQQTPKQHIERAVDDMIYLTMMPPTWQAQMRTYVKQEYFEQEGR